MLISHPHQFIYLKTRKTAGTSVEMAFQPWAAARLDDEVEEPTHAQVSANGVIGRRMIGKRALQPADRVWYNHMPAAEVRALVNARIWSRYVKVAVIRDPFDRMVSFFHWHDTARHTGSGADGAAPPAEDFATVRARFRDLVLSDIWPDDDEIVSIDGQWCLDTVLRYETLHADMARFARDVGIGPDRLALPQTKVSRHLRGGQPVAAYFDADTRDHVRRRMDRVFARFGYDDRPAEQAVAL